MKSDRVDLVSTYTTDANIPSTTTWLNASKNQISSCPQISSLTQLSVLNLAHNEFTCIPSQIKSCTLLKALIMNNNQIQKISNLNHLSQMNTLVLSHNQLQSVSGLSSLKLLKKLSIGHNRIDSYPTLFANSDLRELKLNDNLISNVTEQVSFTPKLEILDLGNNRISEYVDIIHLVSLKKLGQLNLKGNPITSKANYREKIKTMLPSLRILDGKKFELGLKKSLESNSTLDSTDATDATEKEVEVDLTEVSSLVKDSKESLDSSMESRKDSPREPTTSTNESKEKKRKRSDSHTMSYTYVVFWP